MVRSSNTPHIPVVFRRHTVMPPPAREVELWSIASENEVRTQRIRLSLRAPLPLTMIACGFSRSLLLCWDNCRTIRRGFVGWNKGNLGPTHRLQFRWYSKRTVNDPLLTRSS